MITTSVLAVKATPKALLLLEEAKKKKGEKLTTVEKVKVAGPAYIPATLVGMATIACIFGANSLSKNQQASLMSAYAMLDASYKEYREKVTELYGENADTDVKNEIVKDKYEETDIQRQPEKELFFDEFSGRFFNSTKEKVLQAQYQVNRDLFMQSRATINDFYYYLDIPPIDGGEHIGWTPGMNEYDHWQAWVDFSNSKMVDDDGLEYYIVRIFQEPRMGFEDFQ